MQQFAVPYFTAKRDDYQFIIVRRNIRKHESSILAGAGYQLSVAADQVDFRRAHRPSIHAEQLSFPSARSPGH